ncbi:hypothetical protein EIP86_004011 [Pleurotus ostreatoroseus]|nr:hypothetical protein EIP86_004011 [Pleurotus ostreatoroseus]
MSPTVPMFKLNTGADVPAIGLGTWAGFTKEEQAGARDSVLEGLKASTASVD